MHTLDFGRHVHPCKAHDCIIDDCSRWNIGFERRSGKGHFHAPSFWEAEHYLEKLITLYEFCQ
jgi:hypothetical protein